ncbi:hypothetical protein NE237_007186 [Protea cynaroides]|uniref:Uncharacterized protein n=1 Tax=Protea cynaroides TaxID=273540 RepID=A0A9Q0KNX8_9MAGN|nr:hypothetical protein NE237_007186 [Protea cynaroides]
MARLEETPTGIEATKKRSDNFKRRVEDDDNPDLEAELLFALTELKSERNKNKSLNNQLNQANDINAEIMEILNKAKVIADELDNDLTLKNSECKKLEEVVVRLETELAKSIRRKINVEATAKIPPVTILKSRDKNFRLQETSNSEDEDKEEDNILDEIFSYQRSSHIKSRLGYTEQLSEKIKDKGSTDNPIVFVKAKQKESQAVRATKSKNDEEGFKTVRQGRQIKQSQFQRNN